MDVKGGSGDSFWLHRSANQSGISFSSYLGKVPTRKKVEAVFMGTTHGSLGAIAGALVGGLATLPVGGVGAGPGAAIGAAICVVWSGADQVYDEYSEYKKFRATLSKQARADNDGLIERVGGLNEDEKCLLSGEIPVCPVRIVGEKQVYERAALEAWMKKSGTSPATTVPFTADRIIEDVRYVVRTVKICDVILGDEGTRETLKPEQVQNYSLLRDESCERSAIAYEAAKNALIVDLNTRKIGPKEFAERAAELAEIFDPAIGEVATTARQPSPSRPSPPLEQKDP